jgi:hypothetical protein
MASKHSVKDKQMAANLKKGKVRRDTGVCCICYRPIGNDNRAERHYGAHARGASD